jgi:uncharacterized protein
MDVTPLIRRDAKIIQSYKGDAFKVSGELYPCSILIMPTKVVTWTGVQDLISFKDDVDVLLMGTGVRLGIPNPELKKYLKTELNIVLETMDNGAAARTYNVLLAEGRKVAAILTKE